MQSKAKLFGHPIHQQLIVFPLGLLATAVIFDLIRSATNNPEWSMASFYLIGAGVIGGLLAAIFGIVDWFALPSGTRAKRIGLLHGGGNAVVLILFIASFFMRRGEPYDPTTGAYVLSYAGGILALFTGWLGGELVTRLGVGVDDDAGLNASNSLQHEHHHRPPHPTAS